MTKQTKRILKKLFKQHCVDLPASLMDGLHRVYDRDGGWYEFGFYDSEDYSDDEIKELLWEELGRCYVWTPYDCTGQAFTYWIHFHRCPNGFISVIHRIVIDC